MRCSEPGMASWFCNHGVSCAGSLSLGRSAESQSMILGILADTHDELDRTRVAVSILLKAGAEALVHCGDLASPPIVEELAVLPSWFVFGNHDSDMVPYLEEAATATGVVCLGWGGVIEMSGHRIGVAHGHLTTDIRRVLADEPDFLLLGHSHIPDDSRVGTVRRINPGAIHRAERFTVAVLDLANGKLQLIQVPK